MTNHHECAEHIEVVHAEVDKVTGGLWQSMRCTVCEQTFSQYDPGGCDTVEPIPDNAVSYTDPGWEVLA